jgi:hypothetical protein
MKIAVIVTNAGQAVSCAGGVCEQIVRVFEMPADMAEYVMSFAKNTYAAITFALVSEP